jgi:hypothetical protein
VGAEEGGAEVNKLPMVIGLLIIVMMGLVPACSESSDGVRIGANAREASLVEIWGAVEEKAQVQDAFANLTELIIQVDEDGVVSLLHYAFYATDAHGKAGIYFVNSEYGGDVTYYCYPTDGAGFFTTNPLVVFEQLDMVPAATMLSGAASAHLLMDFESGAVAYSSSESLVNLYHLKDGELVPLKEVMFRTNVPWGAISVTRYQGGTVGLPEYWFLTSELGKAESAEYA